MALSTQTVGQLLASGRNYASTLVGFIGGVGVVSAAQDKGLMDSVNEIFTGLGMVFHGFTSFWQILVVAFPIIGLAMGKLASRSATVTNQAAAVVAAVKDPNTPITPEAKTAIVAAANEVSKP